MTMRLDHLLKLSMIMAATRLSTTMDIDDVVTANSILGVAEFSMHKALGHFGYWNSQPYSVYS